MSVSSSEFNSLGTLNNRAMFKIPTLTERAVVCASRYTSHSHTHSYLAATGSKLQSSVAVIHYTDCCSFQLPQVDWIVGRDFILRGIGPRPPAHMGYLTLVWLKTTQPTELATVSSVRLRETSSWISYWIRWIANEWRNWHGEVEK